MACCRWRSDPGGWRPCHAARSLIPVGLGPVRGHRGKCPRVASQCLLDSLALAGVQNAFLVVRQGKWDIPAYWGDEAHSDSILRILRSRIRSGRRHHRSGLFVCAGQGRRFRFSGHRVRAAHGVSRFVCKAGGWSGRSGARAVSNHGSRVMDMVDVDDKGRVRGQGLKPRRTTLRFTRLCAMWMPTFT